MPQVITKDELRSVLQGIECPSEYKYSFSNELDNGYLEFIVQQIIDNGLATDLASAVFFATDYIKSEQKKRHQGLFF